MSKFFNRIAFCYDIIPYLLKINYPLVEKEMDLKKGDKILDVGGGTGRLAERIADSFKVRVTILDSSTQMLNKVEFHPRIEAICGNIERAPFKDELFDVVVCTDTLHHLKNPGKSLQEMWRVLKPRGKIFIQDFDVLKFRTRILKFVEKSLGEPAKFYSPRVLERMLKEIGFSGSARPILKFQYLYTGKRV